ncbi:MAG TPA: Crp/Fnr family transcriptional regulator [Hyphomicrobium sp.]|nr:Crp/Fnr family transcriptional regulator [Hyphomicrobium sp.]
MGDRKTLLVDQVPCQLCPLRKQKIFRPFTPEELAFVTTFKTGEVRLKAGMPLFLEGSHSEHLYTVLSGLAFRYKLLPDGRRQILNYCMPGDFLGLQGSVMQEMQHSVEALSDMVLCIFQREGLWRLFETHAGLSFDVTWLAARSEQLLDQQLLSVGRRTAVERCAHLLLHLADRVAEVGLASSRNRIRIPITQQHVADTLGLSLVHTNRTLGRLVREGAVRWREQEFEILNRKRLAELSGDDSDPDTVRPLL